MLMEALAHRDDLESITAHRRCESCPGGDACKRPAVTQALGYEWPKCPLSMLADPAVGAVVQTYNAAQVSPLSGWPDEYAAYVEEGVATLSSVLQRKARDDAKATSTTTASSFWKAQGVRS